MRFCNYFETLISLTSTKTYGIIDKEELESEVFRTEEKAIRQIAKNRKAWHDYTIEDSFEAGISLCGTEVKSLRQGAANLKDSFCSVKDGELIVHGMHISPYEKGNIFNKEPRRNRKLLMHKSEIRRLAAKQAQEGYTIIPLSLYFKGSLVKVQVGLCKGKKLHDKRDAAAARDAKREMDRALKEQSR